MLLHGETLVLFPFAAPLDFYFTEYTALPNILLSMHNPGG